MSTRVYGASDDLIEFEGELFGEVGCYGTDDREQGVLLTFSDGTLAEVKYGKGGRGIWEIKVLQKGSLFLRLEICDDEDASPYSDELFFKPGKLTAYASTGSWQNVE